MTNPEELFEKHNDEMCKFERVENKRSQRPDLHAFLLLDELQPNGKCIIGAVNHDIIYLSINIDDLQITEEQILELVRCGIMYEEDYECFSMFT